MMSENMTKKYKNPPVVEAWIDFLFQYGEEVSEWNERVAIDFVKSFEQFNQEEHSALVKKEIKLSEYGPIFSEAKPVLQRLKTFNKTKDRCLQIEQNLLVYNMLRKKEVEWPGFSVLLSEAMPFCQKYMETFHPVSMSTVLHYKDNITIPFVEGKIKPEEYFRIYPSLPEDFGSMQDYSLSLILTDTCKDGVVRFSVSAMPFAINESNPKLPFVIDWDVQSIISFKCEDLDVCKTWLNSAHDSVNKAFEDCLTERCRSLFEGD